MRIENRIDGAAIMRRDLGGQRLIVANSHSVELVILSELCCVISVKRHWDEARACTVPCECVGPCQSQRLDRFMEALARVGPTLWEERVLVLAADGWASLERSMVAKGKVDLQVRGARCILRRTGDKRNGRTSCEYQDHVVSIPQGFDLPGAMRSSLGIAADFFGDSEGEAFPTELPPARTRAEKPKVPLGKKQGG